MVINTKRIVGSLALVAIVTTAQAGMQGVDTVSPAIQAQQLQQDIAQSIALGKQSQEKANQLINGTYADKRVQQQYQDTLAAAKDSIKAAQQLNNGTYPVQQTQQQYNELKNAADLRQEQVNSYNTGH